MIVYEGINNYTDSQYSSDLCKEYMKIQSGFTLIELMVVVSILAIIMAFAIPSYYRFTLKNNEQKVKSIMLNQGVELEKWRAKQLNFAGFVPTAVTLDSDNISYRYPANATSTTAAYNLQLVTIANNAAVSLQSNSIASNWVILATPKANSNMPYIALSSQGTKCQSTDSSITAVTVFTNGNCGTGSETW